MLVDFSPSLDFTGFCKHCFAEFKMDHLSTTDEPHNGHLIDVTIPETIERLQKSILSDHNSESRCV